MASTANASNAHCHSCSSDACIGSSERARCETHFIEEFDHQVRLTIRRGKMIQPRERIVVALSGGKDSVVLLHQLSSLRKRLPMELMALLIDEGIAGYRNKTISVAKRECKKAKVLLTILSFRKEFGKSLDKILKIRTDNRTGACAYCGVFRRRLLEIGARRLKADKLAMGHNLDDAAQTVLLNLYRNEPDRLMRFKPVSTDENPAFVPRIRPLIEIPEKEVALYAELKGYDISHQACPYAQEAMRQTVRTQLNEMEDRYAGTKKRIFHALARLQEMKRDGKGEEKKRGAGADKPPMLNHCQSCGEPTSEERCAACRLMDTIGKKRRADIGEKKKAKR